MWWLPRFCILPAAEGMNLAGWLLSVTTERAPLEGDPNNSVIALYCIDYQWGAHTVCHSILFITSHCLGAQGQLWTPSNCLVCLPSHKGPAWEWTQLDNGINGNWGFISTKLEVTVEGQTKTVLESCFFFFLLFMLNLNEVWFMMDKSLL